MFDGLNLKVSTIREAFHGQLLASLRKLRSSSLSLGYLVSQLMFHPDMLNVGEHDGAYHYYDDYSHANFGSAENEL